MTGQDETTTPRSPAASTWAQAREASQQMILQAAMEDLESKASKLEQQLHDAKLKVEEGESKITGLKEQNTKLSASLEETTSQWQQLQMDHKATTLKFQSLEESSKSGAERMDRLESEADTLREEISRLNQSNKEYKEKLVEMETQVKLDDSEVVPLRYQVQRLSSELDALSSHSKWLEGELKSKNEQLANLRTTHASDMADMRSSLDATLEEKEYLSGNNANLRRQLEESENKMERISKELRAVKQESSDSTVSFEQELVSTQRVVAMQKEQMDRLQQKHDSMAAQLEAQHRHALEAEEEMGKQLQIRQKDVELQSKQILQEQADEFKRKVSELEKQLEDANRRRRHAEDGLLLTDSPRSRRVGASTSVAITDRAKATGDADEGDEPLNLTDLYGRLAVKEDELAAETLKRKKAEIRCQRIQAEIEATAPLLIRQREEYELAMERQEEYKKRLEEALGEARASREETGDMQVELARLRKLNKNLEEETTELAKQVQTLLVSRSMESGQAESVPANVVEMQRTNQRLLGEHRRLTATVTELESKLKDDVTSKKLASYEKELATLREDRKRQEVLVESIVQQRDLYRALLAKQDNNLLGSSEEETSALQIVKQQSERTKTLEQEKSELQKEVAKAKVSLDTLERDKEIAAERLARYESLNAELTASVDRLQLLVSSAKADVARSEADAAFHRDKSARLEDALQRARDETAQVNSSKNDMQRINGDLQNSLSRLNSDVSKLEGELEQARMKLRLAETQAEAAKSAEKRIAEESNKLRNELSKQGALIDSIQRIELSLSAKNTADENSLKSQVAALTEKLSTVESKHKMETENLGGKITDQEIQIKDLAQKYDQASKEALDTKKESLAANTKADSLTKKCNQLEAQLRVAKKKLGETGDDQDIEADLRSKITSITEELEAARKEIETLKERSATFQKLAKENEDALSSMTQATAETKKSHEEEVTNLKHELEISETETSKRKEIIAELTNDLSKQREERTKALEAVTKEVAELQGKVEEYKKNAQSAEARSGELEAEIVVLRTEVSDARNNYERELALHSTARTELRTVREEAEAEMRRRKAAEEELASAKGELEEQRSLVEQEKASMQTSLDESQKNLDDTRAQNELLHNQLDKIGEQIEKMQSTSAGEAAGEVQEAGGSPDEASSLQKTVAELREVVKFVRSEKEMIQAQLDSAKRASERERAAAAVARRSLDEARAELKVFQENSKGKAVGGAADEGLKEKLRAAEEQAKLLADSNSHLREHGEKLEQKLAALTSEFEDMKKAAQPTEKRQRELESEKAGLVAERESLLREIEDWKGRVQSLVSKFNQIDPQEHARVVKKVESLEKNVSAMEAEKKDAEQDSIRIRGLASRASKELIENKKLVETYKKTIEKLTSEKDALTKSQQDSTSKKELEEWKEKFNKLETQKESEKKMLTGANEMNEKLRERLRQFQRMLTELRKKETETNNQLKLAREQLAKKQETPSPAPDAQEKPPQKPPRPPTVPETAKMDEIVTAEENTDAPESTPQTNVSDTTKETTTLEKKPEAKPATKIMPTVPPGGFKFAPSPPAEAVPPTESMAAKPAPSDTTKSPTAPVSKKRPADSSEEAQGSKKRPTGESETDQESKTKPVEESKAETSAETSQSAGEQETKPSQSTAEEPAPSPARRASTEKKEMSTKERLLEKKRKLKALKEAKEKMLREQQTRAESAEKEEEHASKKQKALEPPADSKSAETSDATALKPAPSTETVGTAGEEANDDEDGEVQDTEDKEAGEASQEEQAKTTAASGSASTSVLNPFAKPFAASSDAPKMTFGGASAGFGQVASGTTGGFGSGVAKAAPSTPAFSQASAFGSGTGFGSTASGGSSFFGKPSTSGGASVFGAKIEGTSGSSLGESFLNIKPPGSSTNPPQFTFGRSGSITLPTPANPSPQANMFNAFSSPTPFNSTAKPLFGVKKDEPTKTEEGDETAKGDPKEEEKEEGEE